MTNVTTVDFPDINEAFEKTNNPNDLSLYYSEMLRKMNTFANIEHANKLLEYTDIDAHIPHLKEVSSELHDFTDNWGDCNNAEVVVKGRKKAWWEFNAKICLALLESPNDADLTLIRDLLGFKLIVCSSGLTEEETIELCYKLANDVILFFHNEKQYSLLNAEKNISYTSSNNLKPELKRKVKDYYTYPKKEDNYKALHVYVKTRSGLVFEIQILTLEDDLRAEKTHEKHKTRRYANFSLPFDYKKIKFAKVRFDNKGNLLCDYAGLFESKNIFEI